MKNKLIIKMMALLMALLFFANCKKSTANNPTDPIPDTGKGFVTANGVTYSGNCILASTGEVQIINLATPPTFVLRVLNIPQQSSGTFAFTLNPGTPSMEFNTVVAGASVQYGSGGLNVGQITKTGARSFQFSCTLYVIDNNGTPGATPHSFIGAGSY